MEPPYFTLVWTNSMQKRGMALTCGNRENRKIMTPNRLATSVPSRRLKHAHNINQRQIFSHTETDGSLQVGPNS